MNRFSEQVVVITGASTGIGRMTALQFAEEGAKIVLAARGKAKLEELVAEIGPERALAVPTDVSDDTACVALLKKAQNHFGTMNLLVNNAGYNSRGSVASVEPDKLMQIVDVNLRAPIFLSRLAIPYIQKAGGGAIVNVASIAGKIPLPYEATYSATKFGLRVFSLAMAEEIRGSGVTVSVVSPGPVATGFILSKDIIDEIPDIVFSQPMSRAEDVANLILDCAADGGKERTVPKMSGKLATISYLFPGLRELVQPLFEKKGRKEKQKYMARLEK